MSDDSRILILGAMDEEIEALIHVIELEKTIEWKGFKLYFGTLSGRNVLITKSGVGKVFAAVITQHLLSTYSISHVFFTGVAGAIDSAFNPGDVVLGERLIQHDMNVQALGFEIGHIPFTDYRYFQADPLLLRLAQDCKNNGINISTGTIGTGDQFITDKSSLDGLGLDCVDMEGCSVAQVCSLNETPFLIIRIISDKADGSAKIDFAKNLPIFAKRSVALIKGMFSQMD